MMGPCRRRAPADRAPSRAGPGGRRRLRLHAQGPARRAAGHAVPRARAARPHRRRRRRARSATPTCSPAASTAATSCASRGRVERFRDELQVELRAIARAPRGRGRPGVVPARSPTATSTSSTASSSTSPARSTTRSIAALLDALLGDDALRAEWRRAPCTRDGHHAYLGGLLEHTVAVATLAAETCTLHVRLNSDLLITAALVHDLGKTREFTYGAEIALTDEGRLLGHVELGLRLLRERAAGVLDDERRLALVALRADPPRARRAPGRRFGSAEALALYRLNALDASVKGALEHGLG